jgi:outer membrane lipoprotein-sorting protein
MKKKGNTSRKIAAGKPGTKKMVEQYGENLICVRYRYNAEKKVKFKTVEIIVDKGFWDLEEEKLKDAKQVEIKVDYKETEIRTKVKAAGGRWNPEKKVWELGYREVQNLGLAGRILK